MTRICDDPPPGSPAALRGGLISFRASAAGSRIVFLRVLGGGATHAWLQVYLPGAGWVEFDPTNALVGGRNLIRVAVARDAPQAIPLTGSFVGKSDDFLGMQVAVEVTAE